MTSSLPGWHINFISHAKIKRKKLRAIPCPRDGENNEISYFSVFILYTKILIRIKLLTHPYFVMLLSEYFTF